MALNFPAKIYQILENESSDIIRWHQNGMAFRIVDHGRFEREIIPKYFRHNQISSVQRQLNLYGFKCISRGEDKGAFFHPKFKRGDWEIVKKITRYAPLKKPNEEGKDSPADSPTHKMETTSMVTEKMFQTTQYPPTFQNPIHPPVVQAYRAFDPFSYIEANGFPVNGDPVFNSHWQQWAHIQTPFISYAPATAPQANGTSPSTSNMKESGTAMETSSLQRFEEKSSASVSSNSSVNSAEIKPVMVEVTKAMDNIKVKTPTKGLDLSSKSFINVHNDVVTIDPDFDLESEFDLFQDMDHHNALAQDFHPFPSVHHTVSISAALDHPESKTRDFGVNTELTQNGNVDDLYTSCHRNEEISLA